MSQPPSISLRANLWVVIPIGALLVAIFTGNFLLMNYVHVFTATMWTGTDIFMGFILGPIFRHVTIQTRKEIISWLMPKMIFYMSTVTAVTSTAGYYLAAKMGLFTYNTPTVYWISAVVIIVIVMTVQGLGILLPTNLRIYFELRKTGPNLEKIQKWTRRYLKVVISQVVLQIIIVFIMANFTTGL